MAGGTRPGAARVSRRVVLDTDVIVAALRSPAGASAELLRRALDGDLSVVVSVSLVLEYEAVATRDDQLVRIAASAADIRNVIDALVLTACRLHDVARLRPQLRDADDEHVLEAAVQGGADTIVTFNRRDFTGAARFGVEVMVPGDLLKELRNALS